MQFQKASVSAVCYFLGEEINIQEKITPPNHSYMLGWLAAALLYGGAVQSNFRVTDVTSGSFHKRFFKSHLCPSYSDMSLCI